MRTERLERALTIVQVIQSGAVTSVAALAEQIGVSRRTIFRDLGLLARVGLSHHFDRDSNRLSLSAPSLALPMSLTNDEIVALLLATRMLTDCPVAPNQRAARSAALKLEALLPAPPPGRSRMASETTMVRMAPHSDPSLVADLLPLLCEAIMCRTKLHATFKCERQGKALEAILHPYRVAFLRHAWFLLAFDEDLGDLRIIKLGAITHVFRLATRFRPNAAATFNGFLGDAWFMVRGKERFDVKVRFSPAVAAGVEEICWHRTQQTRFRDDGSLLFEVEVEGISEISQWVLGYGDQAEVLEPVELRELVAAHAQGVVHLYPGVSFMSKRA